MGINEFYLYQIGWYLFGTAAAFAAALLFWQKGRSVVSSPDAGSGFGVRLSGAAGIFVAVLLVIHYINPLIPLTDYKKLWLVYSAAESQAAEGDVVHYILEPSSFPSDLIKEHSAVELIPADRVYTLAPQLRDNAFTTIEPIPVGTYWLHIVDSETGETGRYMLEVPSS